MKMTYGDGIVEYEGDINVNKKTNKNNKHSFKIGDWTRQIDNNKKFKILGFSKNNDSAVFKTLNGSTIMERKIKKLILWEPEKEEWCWFWSDSDKLKHPILGQFVSIEEDSKFKYYFETSNVDENGKKIMLSSQYCEPYTEFLPTIINNNKENVLVKSFPGGDKLDYKVEGTMKIYSSK